MANLTISVDPGTLKRARLRAVARGESVNQYLAERLREYASADDLTSTRQRAAQRFVALSEKLAGDSGGVKWSREQIYEQRLDRVGR